jgi:phytoene dehydrogenase-like protein
MLSNYLSGYISNNGGKVILKHIVDEILFENAKARGVKYRSVKNTDDNEYEAFADVIISNASIPDTADNLLPEEQGRILGENIKGLENGASLLSMYLGFNKPLKDIGSKYYSTFFYDPSVTNPTKIKENNTGDFKQRSFTFVDYSQVDSDLCPENKSVGVICCMDYIADWEHLNKEEYTNKKEQVAEIFIEKLEEFIPGVKDHLEFYEIGTSKTVRRYTLNPGGTVYGFAQTTDRLTHDIVSPVENLHFASAWTKVGGGFSGAIFSGYLCATDILRKERQQQVK